MRMNPRSGGKHPPLTLACLHGWTFDETNAANPLRDLAGTATLATLSGSPPVVDGPINFNARQFVRATPNSFRTGSTFAADVVAMTSYTMIGCLRLDAAFAADGYVYLLGSGVTGFSHSLVLTPSASGGAFRVVYSDFGGTIRNVNFTPVIYPGRWVPWAITRTYDAGAAANDTYRLYLDGGRAETIGGQQRTLAASASASWVVGADLNGTSNALDGRQASLFAYSGVLPDNVIEDILANMRMLGFDTSLFSKAEVQDNGGTYRDLRSLRNVDFLRSISVQDDVDRKVRTGKVTLARSKQRMQLGRYNDNVLNKTPFAGDPRTATYSTAGELLAHNRSVRTFYDRRALDSDQVDDNGNPNWNIHLDGIIDNNEWGGDGNEASVDLSDFGRRMMDVFIPITTVRSTSVGSPLETQIQSLITDAKGDVLPVNMTNNWGLPTGTLFDLLTQVSPGWNVRQWAQQTMALLQAINVVAEQIGWTCRVSFSELDNAFRVQLYEPARRQTWPSVVIAPRDILSSRQLGSNIADVRNEILLTFSPAPGSSLVIPSIPSGTGMVTPGRVYAGGTTNTYAPASTSQGEEPNRLTYIIRASDLDPSEPGQDSNTVYGTRRMIVGEASTSNIDTLAEAVKMAVAMLRDLMEPKMTKAVQVFGLPEAEVGDLPKFRRDDVFFTSDQQLATVGWTFDHDGDGAFSVINTRGRPSGGTKQHLEKEVRGSLAPPATGNPTSLDSQAGMETRERRRLHQAMIDLGPHYMRQSRALTGTSRNANLSNRTQGEAPPDGYVMDAGTWDTDIKLVRGTNAETGQYYLDLINVAGRLTGDWIEVRIDYDLAVQVRCYQPTLGGGGSFDIIVDWYNFDRTTLVATTTQNAGGLAPNQTWIDKTFIFAAPAFLLPRASFARVKIQRSAGTGNPRVNGIFTYSLVSNFRAYVSTLIAIPDNIAAAYTQVAFQTAKNGARPDAWDDSNVATGPPVYGEYNQNAAGLNPREFTCRADGWYKFNSHFSVDSSNGLGTIAVEAHMFKNGVLGTTLVHQHTATAVGIPVPTVTVSLSSGVVWLVRGDRVSVWVRAEVTGAGTPQIAAGVENWFSGMRVFPEG